MYNTDTDDTALWHHKFSQKEYCQCGNVRTMSSLTSLCKDDNNDLQGVTRGSLSQNATGRKSSMAPKSSIRGIKRTDHPFVILPLKFNIIDQRGFLLCFDNPWVKGLQNPTFVQLPKPRTTCWSGPTEVYGHRLWLLPSSCWPGPRMKDLSCGWVYSVCRQSVNKWLIFQFPRHEKPYMTGSSRTIHSPNRIRYWTRVSRRLCLRRCLSPSCWYGLIRGIVNRIVVQGHSCKI